MRAGAQTSGAPKGAPDAYGWFGAQKIEKTTAVPRMVRTLATGLLVADPEDPVAPESPDLEVGLLAASDRALPVPPMLVELT